MCESDLSICASTRSHDDVCSARDACWQQISALAKEVSDLASFSLLYEDEDGELRALSRENLEDIQWVASSSVLGRVRLTVRSCDPAASAEGPHAADRCVELLRMPRRRMSCEDIDSDGSTCDGESCDGDAEDVIDDDLHGGAWQCLEDC